MQAPGASLPPPPSSKDAQGDSYLPRSLKRLLEVKAQAEGKRPRLQPSSTEPPGRERKRQRTADAQPEQQRPASEAKAPQQQQQPSKPLRDGRARYLKGKKTKLKQKQQRSQEWAQQTQAAPGDQPAFGEQVLAPLKVRRVLEHKVFVPAAADVLPALAGQSEGQEVGHRLTGSQELVTDRQ